ncbi:MAG: hypothetical protein ACOCVC_08360 [Spirochaeta sp.]
MITDAAPAFTSSGLAVVWFLISAAAFGTAAGWGLRLWLPVHRRDRELLPVPVTPGFSRRIQSWRRSLMLLGIAFAGLGAAAGAATMPSVLLDPVAPVALAVSAVCGLVVIRFPLPAGLPVLLLAAVGSLYVSVQAGPLSPLSAVPDRVKVLPLYIDDEEMKVDVSFSTSAQAGSPASGAVYTLPGNALQLEWVVYEVSPWLFMLRSRMAVPVSLYGGQIPHDDPGSFTPLDSAALYVPEEIPSYLPVSQESHVDTAWYPRLLQARELEFSD